MRKEMRVADPPPGEQGLWQRNGAALALSPCITNTSGVGQPDPGAIPFSYFGKRKGTIVYKQGFE